MKKQTRDFVIFGEDLDRHAHSLEHILKYSFETDRFIWVETIGLRSPSLSLYDLKRVIGKIKSWFSLKKKETKVNKYPSVKVISPIIIPYNQFSFIRTINKYLVKNTLNKTLIEHQFKNIITISSVPQASEYIDSYVSHKKIYFCVDDFSLWPGINHAIADKFEKELIQKSDIVLATATELAKNKSKPFIETAVITHGVDYEHFNIGKKEQRVEICYFGLIDQRMDIDIILNISDRMPEVDILLIGECIIDTKQFDIRKNIRMIGKVSYENLPLSIKNADIFILPYKINELTKNINPLKLKEYLATSRVTISTRLPEVEALSEHLFIADSATDFIHLIHKYMNGSLEYDLNKTIEFITGSETWKSKNFLLNTIIDEMPC